ncbi:MAG: pyridoxamine 5'-phosphate oxidase family protein [Dehalococcoidia bacterium]
MSSPDAIARAIERAIEKAGPTMAANFTHPAWVMSAEEFVAFWGGTRLASVATVGKSGWPHAAPVEVTLAGDRFLVPAFPNSVRMADLRRSPRLVVTTWDDAWHAAIVYGLAELVGASGGSITVRPTRIYAIRAPQGHHASRRAG